MNWLYYGDNLEVLKGFKSDSVDLVYLDPPFKSDADYNVLFNAKDLKPDEAQMMVFKDTWTWEGEANLAYAEIQDLPNPDLVSLVNALHQALGGSPMMAYLAMMALRLHYIRNVMKPEAAVYLHCDPTASAYLKVILDAIFAPQNYLNEIIWRRTGSHNSAKRFGPIHDVIHFYRKSNKYKHRSIFRPYAKGHVAGYFKKSDKNGKYWTNSLHGAGLRHGESGKPWKGYDPTAAGRHWAVPSDLVEMLGIDSDLPQHEKLDALAAMDVIDFPAKSSGSLPTYRQYLDRSPGLPIQDIWAYQPYTRGVLYNSPEAIDEDVRWLQAQGDDERLGYPTQKPLGLLKRILEASSKKGDVVLDPFCGCGTTIEAAQILGRQWIGIDISPFAIQLIRKSRIPSLQVDKDFKIDGLPTTLDGAKMLATQDKIKKAFEIWCVSTLDGYPNEKKGADKGIDGRIKFRPEGMKGQAKYAIVSVKGGKLKPDDIRSLIAVADREKATSLGFGVFVCLEEPTQKMKAEANSVPIITVASVKYPAIQIITVEEMLHGKRPKLPMYDATATYKKAKTAPPAPVTSGLFEATEEEAITTSLDDSVEDEA